MAKRKKTGMGFKGHLLVIAFLMMSIVFSSLAVLLVVGMMPTIVAAIIDRSPGRVRTLTVGFMNFAGCAPFMLEIWKRGNTIDLAMSYLMQPRTVVVMFFAAAIGYMIEWAVTGIVSSVMVQRGRARIKEIAEYQKTLTDRWGPEVSGTMPLDEYGFVIESTAVPASEDVRNDAAS